MGPGVRSVWWVVEVRKIIQHQSATVRGTTSKRENKETTGKQSEGEGGDDKRGE